MSETQVVHTPEGTPAELSIVQIIEKIAATPNLSGGPLMIRRWWCRLLHRGLTFPVNGVYRCTRCWQEWRSPWA